MRERLAAALRLLAGIYTPEDLEMLNINDPAMKEKAIDEILEIFDALNNHKHNCNFY